MAAPPRAALLLALLALPALAPALAQAQDGAAQGQPPTAFTALPAELRAVGAGWLAGGNATLAAAEAARPAANHSLLRLFRDGAWDFLNESRMSLAAAQLLQLEVQAATEAFLAATPPAERRNGTLARIDAEVASGRAAIDQAEARAAAVGKGVGTTHGLEYAVLAGTYAMVGASFLDSAPEVQNQVLNTSVPDEPIVRAALTFGMAPSVYAGFAGDLLDLAARAGADPARPRLPEGWAEAVANRTQQRLSLDPDAGSVTGPDSDAARARLTRGDATDAAGTVARFVAFQQARAADALAFLQNRGQVVNAALEENLRLVVHNDTVAPNYDGRLARVEPPGNLARLQASGYHGVLQLDALNHAEYRLAWDRSFRGLAGAWGQMVGARYGAELLHGVGPSSEGEGAPWLILGGIAVAAALAVTAIAVLRRPGT